METHRPKKLIEKKNVGKSSISTRSNRTLTRCLLTEKARSAIQTNGERYENALSFSPTVTALGRTTFNGIKFFSLLLSGLAFLHTTTIQHNLMHNTYTGAHTHPTAKYISRSLFAHTRTKLVNEKAFEKYLSESQLNRCPSHTPCASLQAHSEYKHIFLAHLVVVAYVSFEYRMFTKAAKPKSYIVNRKNRLSSNSYTRT